MDQELKQRLIGAAIITALAAIFVPMLFDEPVENAGKTTIELKIPEQPPKVQDVDIAPLPQKPEDVTTPKALSAPTEQSLKSTQAQTFAEEETPVNTINNNVPKPNSHPAASPAAVHHETANHEFNRATDIESRVIDEEEPVATTQTITPAKKPVTPVVTPPAAPISSPVVKPAKPKPVEPKATPTATETPSKPVTETPAVGTTRVYLNAGTFSIKNHAVSLQDNLKKQGFAASIKEVSTEKGLVYKVRIGPISDKLKAQEIKNKLTQIDVPSFVIPDE